MTTRPAEAIHARGQQWHFEAFSDWRRYRSAFDEAIGLQAMSEHLPGVTVNGAAGRLVQGASGERRAVISGQDLEFHLRVDREGRFRQVRVMQRAAVHRQR